MEELMPVPLLDLKRQNDPLERELTAAFGKVLHSGQYILGKEVDEFERQAAAVTGVRHAIGVSSGTDALLLALMAVHLFGQPADMGAVMAVASRHNLPVIEDAAQAFGVAPTVGAFGTFSFFPSKNLGGFGEAGLLATNDDALADKARLLRTHG